MAKHSALDAIDLKLLELLQADARLAIGRIAELVGLSTPACYKRIQRLRSTRAIERDMAVVSARTMGWPLMMLVLVTLERERSVIIDQFIRKIQSVPEIIDAWYVTGDHDFVLRFVAEDMESFEAMTRDVLYADEHVKSFKTLVSMRQIKANSPIPAVQQA
jgi:Lrp/AsnC family transcriptional regulator, leucine-responsive regulatory protein